MAQKLAGRDAAMHKQPEQRVDRANGRGKTFGFAIEDIFAGTNLAIALISGLIGYVVVEYL